MTSVDFTLKSGSGCWHYAGKLEHMSREEVVALRELVNLTARELDGAQVIEEQADQADGKSQVVGDRGEWLAPKRRRSA